jgi:hypothetical protein
LKSAPAKDKPRDPVPSQPPLGIFSRSLLAARSELGYTDQPFRALPREPEAVSEEEQRRQTAEARRRAARDRLAQWHDLRADILHTADRLRVLLGPRSSWAIRDLNRLTDRLDRQVRG